MLRVFHDLKVPLVLVLALTLACLFVVPAHGQAIIWNHFPYDIDVLTSTAGTGPNAVENGSPGPTVVNTNPAPRYGNGSAVNQAPTKGGFVTITYDRQDSWSWSFWLWLAENIAQLTVVLQGQAGGEFVFQLTAEQTLQFQYEGGIFTDFNNYIIPVNTWTHFVVTGSPSADGGNLIISEYVNAVFATDYEQPAKSPSGSKSYIVLENGGYNQDELWIFNSALTQDEIKQLFTSNTVN